jgi:hypothetical protein
MTFECSGKCTSSVRPSSAGTGRLERFCQCCQESDSITRHARLLCPNIHGESPFKSVIVPLTIPLVCVCLYEDRYISRQTNVSNRKRTKQFVRGHKFSSRRILRPIVTNII